MARLTFLGTGDPLNEERAQTSLVLPLGDHTRLLIDTSGGTILLRQLQRAAIEVPQIRHIVISHRHFDHLGGLAPLLVALVPFTTADVTIYATRETLDAAQLLLDLTIPGLQGWLGERLHWQELHPEQTVTIEDARLTPFVVEHGIDCIGVRFDREGKRLVFSADTVPCSNVIRHARDADLLIHEAYSLEQEVETAHRFGHSTAADAGRTAREAAAHRLILTHFRATRFVDPTALAAEATAHYGKSATLANDLETVIY